jgi:hypothetical protein
MARATPYVGQNHASKATTKAPRCPLHVQVTRVA